MATQHRIDTRPGAGNGSYMTTRDEPQLRDLLKQLANDGSTLMRSEIALAKLEMRDMAREVALDTAKLAAAIGLALTGALALVAAAVIGLGHALDGRFGLSALIIGAILLVIGGLMARGGIAGLKNVPKPEQTMATMRTNAQWAKDEAREFRDEIRS